MRNVLNLRLSSVLSALLFLNVGGPMLWGVSFTFTTLTYPGAESTFVKGINNAGEIVGAGRFPPYRYEGFLYADGKYTPSAIPGVPESTPVAINNKGTVLMTDLAGAVYEVNGAEVSKAPVPNYTGGSPIGINDLGHIAGTDGSSSGVHGYFFNGSTYQTLDRPGYEQTYATGINDLDQIVGYTYKNGRLQGFLYAGGTYQTISVPGAYATLPASINNLGQIAGTYFVGSMDEPSFGFVDTGGIFSTFESPTGFSYDMAINDAGQVAGTWFYSNSSPYTGFVGNPVPTPEPGTMALVGIGTVCLAGAALRRCAS